MPNFAVIVNDFVNNIIVAESLEDAESLSNYTCVELSDGVFASIGWGWDGSSFINPNPSIE